MYSKLIAVAMCVPMGIAANSSADVFSSPTRTINATVNISLVAGTTNRYEVRIMQSAAGVCRVWLDSDGTGDIIESIVVSDNAGFSGDNISITIQKDQLGDAESSLWGLEELVNADSLNVLLNIENFGLKVQSAPHLQ